ncbi:adenosylcobinamide-phosphate synthase CbiB [Methylocystis heyeri]|uniref:Cobalamin biosynthesis protein CobD n=1 Tax=Methylocystis heyeri TaxID=391905 RepID=A0A6B8KHM9_9HYPH|nr:adenosylcobinamide-phosphate synthase CbiB [Methylocystis heyeri]QGM45980.1 cobalamin biosynthesis protein CobD [Methylocystis heyeri]
MATAFSAHFGLALAALAAEAALGYPPALFARIGHPVVWIGAAIEKLETGLNRGPPLRRRLCGVVTTALLLSGSLALGAALQAALLALPFGFAALALVSCSLLAQRSLYAHVAEVARGLEVSLEDGRAAVSKIVGRDVSRLDEAGVSRAAIESLAENFSDGIVAPVLWMALLGLPGALAYKAINTADSMIGHRSERYVDFGWASARLDDLLNLPASRLSALLLTFAAGRRAGEALTAVRRDARKHASPNAGWPEAAMAGALGLRLGGPRKYGEQEVLGATLGDGRAAACADDIHDALALYRRALAGLWAAAAVGAAAGW